MTDPKKESLDWGTDEKVLDPVHQERVPAILTIENFRVLGMDPQDEDFYMGFSEERRKRVIRKVDVRLVPMLAVLYLISHLDRSNIGNAKIEGLVDDLGLSGIQWNIVLSIFFVPYVLLEVPSNMLLKNFKRPSVYLGILIVSWGIMMTLTGVVKNFAGLMVTRVLLGAFEAGFFPGAVYLCTFWYMPKDLATRLACFYCASALSGAFSGLLAAGIAQMNGVGGYEGWRWIFILEGLATVCLGCASFFLLIDSPRLSGRWLDPDEIRFLELQAFIKEGGKFRDEAQGGSKRIKWKDLKAVFLNWRMYILAYIMLCQSACTYGNKFTLPTITKSMGFSNTQAQLLTVPPYVAGAISAIGFSRLSDKFYWRMPFVVIPLCLLIIGYSILMSMDGKLGENLGLSFFSVIIALMGLYPIHPATSSWTSNNLTPSNRRAIGLALNICIGNSGGIIGSYMFLEEEAPKYYTGFGLSLALGGSAVLLALLLELSFYWENKKKEKVSEEEVRARYSEEQLLDMGDKSPLFKYTL
ncbi:putative MFS transporter [Aspergillus affinis]|uniref:putative MFS transporter n=1 Tax=Aspergillus affinis TaxID=1070780 RepID=UPI0022FEAC47|nr:Ankyrin repeat-containing domain-containing protein [Aspergillus affinis]KAI9043582.1 Ankyrin repeat-containing domain-containing protein [Aspergillus affinis]